MSMMRAAVVLAPAGRSGRHAVGPPAITEGQLVARLEPCAGCHTDRRALSAGLSLARRRLPVKPGRWVATGSEGEDFEIEVGRRQSRRTEGDGSSVRQVRSSRMDQRRWRRELRSVPPDRAAVYRRPCRHRPGGTGRYEPDPCRALAAPGRSRSRCTAPLRRPNDVRGCGARRAMAYPTRRDDCAGGLPARRAGISASDARRRARSRPGPDAALGVTRPSRRCQERRCHAGSRGRAHAARRPGTRPNRGRAPQRDFNAGGPASRIQHGGSGGAGMGELPAEGLRPGFEAKETPMFGEPLSQLPCNRGLFAGKARTASRDARMLWTRSRAAARVCGAGRVVWTP